MNTSADQTTDHQAGICLGSNIHPEENIRQAIHLLRQRTRLLALSTCWETAAVGSSGPNFLNIGACIATPLDAASLKEQVLAPIEKQLGRVRTADKNAPRTIDLDITIFDGQVLDTELWRRVYLAIIFAELSPGLINPETGETLKAAAARLQKSGLAISHPELIP